MVSQRISSVCFNRSILLLHTLPIALLTMIFASGDTASVTRPQRLKALLGLYIDAEKQEGNEK